MTRVKRTAAAGLASTGGFVNPYTFVPLPTAASPRHAPISHRTFTGRSGRITVEVETLTPLLIGGEREAATTGRAATVSPIRLGDKYVIPATTLKGMVRSMVEVMTGSCLRNVDLTRRFTRRAVVGEALRCAYIACQLPTGLIGLQTVDKYKLDELRTCDTPVPLGPQASSEGRRPGDSHLGRKPRSARSKWQGPSNPEGK